MLPKMLTACLCHELFHELFHSMTEELMTGRLRAVALVVA
jgi:hypothetical protein